MHLIYYIIICYVILIFIGFLVSRIIDRFHKNLGDTVRFLHSMGEDLDIIAKDLKEMNKMLEDKSMKLDGVIDKAKENGKYI